MEVEKQTVFKLEVFMYNKMYIAMGKIQCKLDFSMGGKVWIEGEV